MIYLLVGEDELYKQKQIQSLRQKLFNPRVESFNYEVLYAKELTLSSLKESLNRLPAAAQNRLIVIKDASGLKDNQKQYLIESANLPANIVLVLDAQKVAPDDVFFRRISKIARVIKCATSKNADAFNLAYAIERKQPDYALHILADLLRRGEKPERILGGIRYHLVRNALNLNDKIRKIRLLLEADLRIKTGKLKAEFALEALIVKLCL